MILSLLDEQEITKTVQQFKNKVSTDFTDINIRMAKTIINEIVKPLNHMCNVFSKQVCSPNKLKLPKLFQYLRLGISVYSQIIDLSL